MLHQYIPKIEPFTWEEVMNESARNLKCERRLNPFEALRQLKQAGWIESTDGWRWTLTVTGCGKAHVINKP